MTLKEADDATLELIESLRRSGAPDHILVLVDAVYRAQFRWFAWAKNTEVPPGDVRDAILSLYATTIFQLSLRIRAKGDDGGIQPPIEWSREFISELAEAIGVMTQAYDEQVAERSPMQ